MKYGKNIEGRKPPLDSVLRKLYDYAEHQNIAADLDEDDLKELGAQVYDDYEIDKDSRQEWEECAEAAMDNALQKREPKNYPFENASNIKWPLVTVAAQQFGARAYPAIVDGMNIVKGVPIGDDKGQPQVDPQTGQPAMQQGEDGQPQPVWEVEPGAKREKAERIGQHMSYQLLYEMEEWEADTDSLLHHLPIVGCAFRKVYRDANLGRNRSIMRPALNIIVNNAVTTLDDAQRVTDEIEVYPQDIEEKVRAGDYIELELMPAEGNDEDSPHDFLEQHRYIDLDKDGYREPYIVTVHKETHKVARIVANFKVDDIQHDGSRVIRIPKKQYFIKYAFLRDPKGGFYDVGFGQLLESLSEVINTTVNQMLDAGNLQNAGGGFIGSGLRLKKSTLRFTPGQYKYVEAPGSVIKDAIYNMEHPGPSPVLYNLLEMLLSAATDITGVKDIMTGETGGKVIQPTTIMAMVEQGQKVFTAIYKRVWTAMRAEFKLLFELNAEFMDEQEYFNVLDNQEAIARTDYDSSTIDVAPVADPRMVTDMQRSARAQFLMEMLQHPFINQEEALTRIFNAMGEPNLDTLITPPQQGGPSPEEMALMAEQESKQAELQANMQAEQMKAQSAMAIEEMKAQTTAQLQRELEAVKADLAAQKQNADIQTKQAELEIKRQEVALKEYAARLDAELKTRELEQDGQIRREEIAANKENGEKKESEAKEKANGKTEPVNVVLNIAENSGKKVTVERGKDGKISGAKVDG